MAPFDGAASFTDATVPDELAADPAEFKEALARLAGGVAIISGWDRGEPHGLLVSSITGLSVEPPRFLFCVRKEASSHEAILRNDICGVTILSRDDEAEAQTFVDPGLRNRRFQSGRWLLDFPTPPLRQGGLSSASCRITSRLDAGSHTILVATARNIQWSNNPPLLAFNRGFGSISDC